MRLLSVGCFWWVDPPCLDESIVKHLLCGGRILRPVQQASRKAKLSCISGCRIDIKSIDSDSRTSYEFVLLHVLLGFDYGLFNRYFESDLLSVFFDESDRSRSIRSSVGLEH
jgi:hypothetical protein